MRIVFMGTPEFAVPSLERLVDNGYKPVAVATGPDRPRGRGQKMKPTPVKEAALRLGVETVLQPGSVRDPAFAAELAELDPDLFVVVAFKILPPEVFTIPAHGSFNLHGSLLPRYRGAAPINRAVMAGETETGVTTFFLREKVDTGDMILQRRMPIGSDETAGEVHDRMMQLGADAVLETVRRIETGDVEAQPQDSAEATPAPKIFRDDCEIPWDREARQVHDHIRGLSPYPGAWTWHDGAQLKVYRSAVASDEADPVHPPGTVLGADEEFVVACAGGALRLLEVQQEGRKKLEAAAFLRGYDVEAGEQLG